MAVMTAREDSPSRPRKALTIGAVAKILSAEFDDISISKIRYLEDQKLLSPRRTAGGYRLYSQADVERLTAILRMQRDEFLPLRVIRQELATGDFSKPRTGETSGITRRAMSVDGPLGTLSEAEMVEQAGVSESFLRELQEYGIVQPHRSDGRVTYDETDLEIVRAASELSRFGVGGRNLQGLPQLGRPRGGAARADRRGIASLAQPGPPPGGRREPGEPRRHLRPPEAPSAGSRPPTPHRRVAPAPAMPKVGRTRVISSDADRTWDLISDPHHLARWWPLAQRVEDVRDEGDGLRWTLALRSERGTQVRADYSGRRCRGRAPLRLGPAGRGHAVRADPALGPGRDPRDEGRRRR